MALIRELAKRGILEEKTASELEIEAKTSGKKEEEILFSRNLVPEETIFSVKSELVGVPYREIDPEEVTSEALELMPEETAKHYQMIPISLEGKTLTVGMVYPEDLASQEALQFLLREKNLRARFFLISFSNFQKLLAQYRALSRELGKTIEELEKEMKLERRVTAPEIERLAEEAPVAKTVAVILRYAVEGKASDIHIEPLRNKLRVRLRFLGNLYSTLFLPLSAHPAIVSRIKILANLRIDETRIPQDGRFTSEVAGKRIDFRVSTFPTAFGEKVAIRVLDPEVGLKKFEELGLSPKNFEVVKKNIKKPFGLVLVTGPTGCGKTTTLYAILQTLNREEVNIVTLEDPVEYFIDGINQSQIRPEIGYDFATGLRHILRQDPDIIMVGEIRDSETAFLATHAALTGHLVLSTLHTNNVLGIIPRLIDLGVPQFLIPPTLSLGIAQRLVKKLCQNCKKKVKPTEEMKQLILAELEKMPENVKKELKIKKDFYVYEPVGCKECDGKGFSGRIGLFEVLEMTRELEEIILKEPTETKIAQEAQRQGMLTMRQDGILKVLDGVTTISEVLKETSE
jgi:type IV pilus assembly protein PilB